MRDALRRLIDAIATPFGFVRSAENARPAIELIVFHTAACARQAGFRGNAHPHQPHLQAWWPGLGVRGLMMRPLQRVTIPSDLVWHRTPEGPIGLLLRQRQMPWGDKALWIEL